MIHEEQKIYVNVKVINDGIKNIYLGINLNAISTIYDIKTGLYNKTFIHPNHQCILLEGNEYGNNVLLKGLKLQEKNCLHMIVRSPNIF